MGCPAALSPVCAVGGVSSDITSSVLSAIEGWIVSAASWLLQQIGGVISSTTAADVQASWFVSHYQLMVALAGVVAVPMLMLAVIQAVYHQSPAVLARAALVHLPLAGILTAAAVQLVQLSLTATDALCAMITRGTNGEVTRTLQAISVALVHEPLPTPTFLLTVGALLLIGGSLVLWLELIVRAAAIYVAVLFLPLALASLVWPAISHWCRRLVETLAALVLSKFVVVAVLSLAVGAVASGGGFATVLAGGALLLLASFTPFTLLRLVPIVEAGAALQLEGARHRVRQTAGGLPTSAVHVAMRHGSDHATRVGSAATPGSPGTGRTVPLEAPGSDDAPGGDAPTPGGPGGPGAGSGGGGWIGGAAGGIADVGSAAGGGGLASGMLGGGGLDSPSTRPPPPGTIPVWEGSPSSVAAALEGWNRPGRIEPDGYGGIVPGVQSPLWGGTEPFSRFEPGPKDDWTADDLRTGYASAPSPLPGGADDDTFDTSPGDPLPGDRHIGDGH